MQERGHLVSEPAHTAASGARAAFAFVSKRHGLMSGRLEAWLQTNDTLT